MTRIRLRIEGRVQGVGFRYAAREEGRRIGVRGWVRNRPDGAVTARVEGTPEQVEAFVRWCHEGPPRAHVDHVRRTADPSTDDLPESFAVER